MAPRGAIFYGTVSSMETTRILGIDPGFDRLGLCILEKDGNKETLLHSHCIETSRSDSFGTRLAFIASHVEAIVKKYKPKELAIEKLFFTKNQTTAIPVAEVRGVILYIAHMHGLIIDEYSPPEIKLAVAGHGQASKHDIFRMVEKILALKEVKGRKDDELDAIAIALTHSAHRRMRAMSRQQ